MALILISCGIGMIVIMIAIPSLLRARMGVGGLATGGAKDIQLFRHNIANGYLPHEADISYEGLYYDYYFNTLDEAGAISSGESPLLFRPVFAWSTPLDPMSGARELYLALGLRSDLDTSRIARQRLNLCIVLDISASMSAPFYSYYYDSIAERDSQAIAADPDRGATKLQVAGRSIGTMLDYLQPDDLLGVVLYNDRACVAKHMRRVGATDMEAIKRHFLALAPSGGTFMQGGLEEGRKLFIGYEDADREEVENRIIFITDAMPNIGFTATDDLAALARQYAQDRIHCTFVGVGVDFQAELVDQITKVRGANYYSAQSAWEFKKRLEREFNNMMIPWAFELTLRLPSESYAIEAVYGSPESDQAKGELMHVSTLFPAPMRDEAVKGGIVLLKLRSTGKSGETKLMVQYRDRSDRRHEAVSRIAPPPSGETHDNVDVRKAILLARYVTLMREWLREERAETGDGSRPTLSPWERNSTPLHVSESMKARMRAFALHFRTEAQAIGDPDLEREEKMLALLVER